MNHLALAPGCLAYPTPVSERIFTSTPGVLFTPLSQHTTYDLGQHGMYDIRISDGCSQQTQIPRRYHSLRTFPFAYISIAHRQPQHRTHMSPASPRARTHPPEDDVQSLGTLPCRSKTRLPICDHGLSGSQNHTYMYKFEF